MFPTILGRVKARRIARVVAFDSFSRTTTAGSSLGTMDSGQTWSGGTTGVNADGSRCVISVGSAATRQLTVGTTTYADIDQRIDFDLAALPNSGTYTIGVMARYADTTHHYRLRALISTLGAVQVAATYINGGSETLIGSNTTVAGLTVATDTRYCIRARVTGNRFQVKAWAAASPEPTTWTYDQTDSTISAAGDIGLRVNSGTSTTMVLHIDNYLVRTTTGVAPLRAASLGDQPFTLQAEDASTLEAEDASALEGSAE